MPRKEDIIRLSHMLEAARKARGYVGKKSRNEFLSDQQCQDAVVRCVEVIGEAAAKLSASCQAELPDIPWKNIINMRNRLAHAYFDINLDTVWNTVSDDLPPLITVLERAVPSEKK